MPNQTEKTLENDMEALGFNAESKGQKIGKLKGNWGCIRGYV